MQPYYYKESFQALKQLIKNGEWKFDLTKRGEILQPIGFGYCAWIDPESRFHSFTGKIASGRWGIRENRK